MHDSSEVGNAIFGQRDRQRGTRNQNDGLFHAMEAESGDLVDGKGQRSRNSRAKPAQSLVLDTKLTPNSNLGQKGLIVADQAPKITLLSLLESSNTPEVESRESVKSRSGVKRSPHNA